MAAWIRCRLFPDDFTRLDDRLKVKVTQQPRYRQLENLPYKVLAEVVLGNENLAKGDVVFILPPLGSPAMVWKLGSVGGAHLVPLEMEAYRLASVKVRALGPQDILQLTFSEEA